MLNWSETSIKESKGMVIKAVFNKVYKCGYKIIILFEELQQQHS